MFGSDADTRAGSQFMKELMGTTVGGDYIAGGPVGTYSTVFQPDEGFVSGVLNNPAINLAASFIPYGQLVLTAAKAATGETLHFQDYLSAGVSASQAGLFGEGTDAINSAADAAGEAAGEAAMASGDIFGAQAAADAAANAARAAATGLLSPDIVDMINAASGAGGSGEFGAIDALASGKDIYDTLGELQDDSSGVNYTGAPASEVADEGNSRVATETGEYDNNF